MNKEYQAEIFNMEELIHYTFYKNIHPEGGRILCGLNFGKTAGSIEGATCPKCIEKWENRVHYREFCKEYPENKVGCGADPAKVSSNSILSVTCEDCFKAEEKICAEQHKKFEKYWDRMYAKSFGEKPETTEVPNEAASAAVTVSERAGTILYLSAPIGEHIAILNLPIIVHGRDVLDLKIKIQVIAKRLRRNIKKFTEQGFVVIDESKK